MSIRYTVKNLAELADYFDTLASDQRASLRWNKAAKRQLVIETTADAYADCAKIVRNVDIKSEE